MQRTLVYSMRAKTKRQNITLFHLSWEQAHQLKFFTTLYMPVNDYKNAAHADFGVQINFSE